MTTIRACSVSVAFDDAAVLTDVTVTVAPGELVCIVGPNGAGKTTLLRCLAGELRPTSGTVSLDDRSPSSLPVVERARARAFLAQTDRRDVPYDVETVVGFGTHLADLDTEGRRDIVNRCMDTMQIDHLAARVVSSLSGGERRRVSIARVLAQDNGVLVLDEPTDALDLAHADLVMTVVAERSGRGDAIVASSHDLNLAAKHADRVIVMQGGRTVAEGRAIDVFNAELLSSVYRCDVTVIAHPDDGRPVVFL
jgi:iron complex transport system ATP-binding protein